jgi:outer membrane protein assembly factor BamB
VFITPAVAGDTLYIGSCSGRFLALDAATGVERWTHDTATDGPSAEFHGDVLIDGDLLFVGADADPVAHLYAFELATGRVVWKLSFPGGVPAQVLGRGELIFAQAAAGEVWALDRRTGQLAWMHEAVSAGGPNRHQVDPVLAGERLIVGWPSGDVEALDVSSGELAWRSSTGSRLNTSLALVGDQVLVGSIDGKLHRLAVADGSASPPIPLEAMPFGDLVVTDRCLLVLTMKDGYRLTCRDLERGEPLWERVFASELTTFRPLRLDEEVIVGHRGSLVGLRLRDGGDAWSCSLAGVPRGLHATQRHLFVGTLAGVVMALPRQAGGAGCLAPEAGRSPPAP